METNLKKTRVCLSTRIAESGASFAHKETDTEAGERRQGNSRTAAAAEERECESSERGTPAARERLTLESGDPRACSVERPTSTGVSLSRGSCVELATVGSEEENQTLR